MVWARRAAAAIITAGCNTIINVIYYEHNIQAGG